jgi:acetylornithine/succinyldiaminopimelate/putrescine aminotransferase
MSSTSQVTELFNRFVIGNYTRYPVCLVRGEGSAVWDAEGKR